MSISSRFFFYSPFIESSPILSVITTPLLTTFPMVTETTDPKLSKSALLNALNEPTSTIRALATALLMSIPSLQSISAYNASSNHLPETPQQNHFLTLLDSPQIRPITQAIGTSSSLSVPSISLHILVSCLFAPLQRQLDALQNLLVPAPPTKAVTLPSFEASHAGRLLLWSTYDQKPLSLSQSSVISSSDLSQLYTYLISHNMVASTFPSTIYPLPLLSSPGAVAEKGTLLWSLTYTMGSIFSLVQIFIQRFIAHHVSSIVVQCGQYPNTININNNNNDDTLLFLSSYHRLCQAYEICINILHRSSYSLHSQLHQLNQLHDVVKQSMVTPQPVAPANEDSLTSSTDNDTVQISTSTTSTSIDHNTIMHTLQQLTNTVRDNYNTIVTYYNYICKHIMSILTMRLSVQNIIDILHKNGNTLNITAVKNSLSSYTHSLIDAGQQHHNQDGFTYNPYKISLAARSLHSHQPASPSSLADHTNDPSALLWPLYIMPTSSWEHFMSLFNKIQQVPVSPSPSSASSSSSQSIPILSTINSINMALPSSQSLQDKPIPSVIPLVALVNLVHLPKKSIADIYELYALEPEIVNVLNQHRQPSQIPHQRPLSSQPPPVSQYPPQPSPNTQLSSNQTPSSSDKPAPSVSLAESPRESLGDYT